MRGTLKHKLDCTEWSKRVEQESRTREETKRAGYERYQGLPETQILTVQSKPRTAPRLRQALQGLDQDTRTLLSSSEGRDGQTPIQEFIQ